LKAAEDQKRLKKVEDSRDEKRGKMDEGRETNGKRG
jgi:hypothetical protein